MSFAFFSIHLVAIWLLFKRSQALVVIFFLFIYVQLKNLLSLAYIDLGDVYMSEIAETSTASSATLIASFFFILTIFLFWFLHKISKGEAVFLEAEQRQASLKYSRQFAFVMLALITLLCINIVLAGSPLLGAQVNKTNIWENAPFQFLTPISNQLSFLVLISGIFFSDSIKKRKRLISKLYVAVWLLCHLYLALMGHKFGQHVTFFYLFALPSLLGMALMERIKISRLVVQLTAVIGILSILVIKYFTSKYGQYGLSRIFDRVFALEGQLTYSAINSFLRGEDGSYSFSKELSAVFSGNGTSGMDYLMYKYLPTSFYNYYKDLDVNLSQGYLAILFEMFHSIPIILVAHTAFVMAIYTIGRWFTIALIKRDIIVLFLTFKIFYSFYTYYVQAYTDAVFELKNVFYFALLAIILLARGTRSTRMKA